MPTKKKETIFDAIKSKREELRDSVSELENQLTEHLDRGVKVAGVRARKEAQRVKQLAQELRNLILQVRDEI